MRTCIFPDQTTPVIFMQENSSTQRDTHGPAADLEARIAELELELKKQKAEAEKRARLVQIIWGDRFESDSLH